MSTFVLVEFRNVCLRFLSMYQFKHVFIEYQCFGLVQEFVFVFHYLHISFNMCFCQYLCFG